MLDGFWDPLRRGWRLERWPRYSQYPIKHLITIPHSSSRESNTPLHTPRAPKLVHTLLPHLIFFKKENTIFRYFMLPHIKTQENFKYFNVKNKWYKDWDFWAA